MSDFLSVFVWWLTILITGSIFLPLTNRLFPKFADKGYIFSKILGIVLSSYAVWLLASAKIFPFTRLAIFLVLGVSLFLNYRLMKSRQKDGGNPVYFIILEEILFFACLAFWSYVRANEPSIRGLEKFMDFGFVNSILRSQYFPPLDMWLAKSPDYQGGHFINYYYYGHYIAAFLTKLSGLDAAVTYNLMMATLFAFSFTMPFSIALNLYHFVLTSLPKLKITLQIEMIRHKGILTVVGLLAGFIVALGGNLHTVYVFTSGYPNESPVPFWQLWQENGFKYNPASYWYPNATRFIPFTIHEFPIYSFVVADLHGHVSDIPVVFLMLAVLMSIIVMAKSPKGEAKGENRLEGYLWQFERHTGIPFPFVFLLGLLISVSYMTNAWDGMIYGFVSLLVIFYRNLKLSRLGDALYSPLYRTFSATLFLLFFFLVLNLPFSMNFKPFVSGVGVLCSPDWMQNLKLDLRPWHIPINIEPGSIGPLLFEKDKCQKSPLYMLFLLWGFFFFNALSYLLIFFIPRIRKALMQNRYGDKKSGKNTLQVKNPVIKRILTAPYSLHDSDFFVLILIFVSTLLLIFPEFFYMKDIYPAHYRANTMFKLGYQAFMMLGTVSAYIFFRLKNDGSGDDQGRLFALYKAGFIVVFILIAIYPRFAINSYYNGLKNYTGLYGLKWMETQYPDDYKAITWIRENVNCETFSSSCKNQPVIVEANGDSYTDYDRVSAYTGLPTIVGWPVHEWLWRGSYDEAGKRIPEVASVYESKDMEETKRILRKYNVEYIFLGQLEREKYPSLDEAKLDLLGRIVFESGKTKIIRVDLDKIPQAIPASSILPSPTISK